MTTGSSKTPVNIFVASGSELKKERLDTILILHNLRKIFTSLDLEAVEWETDIPSGSYDKQRIQDEINPLLDKCRIVLVLFYSKTGAFTLEEYRLAREKNKKVFLYFKTGFSPKNQEESKQYTKLLAFKTKIDKENNLIFKEYKTLKNFKEILSQDLTLYLKDFSPIPDPVRELDEKEIRMALYRGSRAYYDNLRGPNGRFRFLKISDILFTGTETQWLETNVDIDNNEKLFGGPRGAGDLLESASSMLHSLDDLSSASLDSKPSPLLRAKSQELRATLVGVLPLLWKSADIMNSSILIYEE